MSGRSGYSSAFLLSSILLRYDGLGLVDLRFETFAILVSFECELSTFDYRFIARTNDVVEIARPNSGPLHETTLMEQGTGDAQTHQVSKYPAARAPLCLRRKGLGSY
jgi:hypothetical protein